MRVPFLLPAALLACGPVAPAPASGEGPLQVEVRLSPEDRAWVEQLLVGREPVPVPEPHETRPLRPTAVERPPRPRPEEGPILTADYDSGTPLYEGVQVRTTEGWKRDGPWSAWHADGQLWEQGGYRDGEEDGPWKWWYENGRVQAEGSFVDGQHVGPWVFYHENGQMMAEGAFEEDHPRGRWVTYWEDGSPRSEGEYVQGERSGRWRFYGSDGVLDPEVSGLYERGERVGE